jgi:hypothetical protein
LDALVETLRSQGHRATAIALDVTHEDSIAACLDATGPVDEEPLLGRDVGTGLVDEISDRSWAVVDATDGRVNEIAASPRSYGCGGVKRFPPARPQWTKMLLGRFSELSF